MAIINPNEEEVELWRPDILQGAGKIMGEVTRSGFSRSETEEIMSNVEKGLREPSGVNYKELSEKQAKITSEHKNWLEAGKAYIEQEKHNGWIPDSLNWDDSWHKGKLDAFTDALDNLKELESK